MRRSTAAQAVIVATLVVPRASALPAQQPRAPLPTFRAGVDLVQLDVSVLDKDRKPVHGLTAADFTVLEDGHPQMIAAFQAFDIPDPVIPKTTWMRDVAPDVATNRVFAGRMVVVLFNDGITRTNVWSASTASRIADKVLDQIGPDDLAAVVYMIRNTTAQGFTSDRSLIRAAFTNLQNKMPFPFSTKGTCQGPALDALLRLADELKDEPSLRKAILFVTPGFPAYPTRNACFNGGMEDFLRAAQRANISVYPVDPGIFMGGVDFAMMSDPSAFPGFVLSRAAGLDGLRFMADSTGGRAVINDQHDDPEAEIPSIFEENSSYYLLGFQSTNPKLDNRYRKLSVTVNRPGLTVRTRDGYFPGPPKADKTTLAPLTPLEQAEVGMLPATGMPLRMAASAIWIRGQKNAAVAVTVGLQQEAAPSAPEHIRILTSAFDLDGKSQGELRQQFDVSPSGVVDRGFRYEVLSRLDLAPGRYDLRVATEDDAGRHGSVFTSLDVPDFAKAHLALSGVAFGHPTALVVPAKTALADLLPVAPTADRAFASTDHATAFVWVYEGSGGPRPATMTATIVDEHDQRVFQQTNSLAADRFTTTKTTGYQLELPLATLAPGSFLLTLDATTDAGNTTAQRKVRFDVR